MFLAEPVWLGLYLLDWIVLILYFLVVVAVGVISYMKVDDLADYFMGGRRFGKVFMMFFAFGSGTSSEQAISVVAGTWRVGLAGIWWQFLWLWATPFYWIVAPIMRRMRALTTADFFEARFNTSTATLYSLCGIIFSIVFIAGGLYSSGKMVNALTGGELETMAERIDFKVPERKWDKSAKRFNTGTLATLDDEYLEDLQGESVSPRWEKAMRKLVPLSDDLRLEVVTPEEAWTLHDDGREVSYPIRKITETIQVDDENVERTTLKVSGSGWRQVQGFEYAILAMTVMFVIYGLAGGLGAAIVTDFIQGVLTIAFSFLLLPFMFHVIGGFGTLQENADLKIDMLNLTAKPEIAEALGREPMSIFYICMLSVTALAGIVVQPHIMGVCGAGKTEFEGRFGFTVGNFLKRFCTLAWTFTGLACIVWYLGADSPLKDNEPATYEALRQRANFTEFQVDTLSREVQSLPPEQQPALKPLAGLQELSRDEREEILTQRLAELRKHVETLPADPKHDINTKLNSEIDRINKVENQFADELFGRAAYDILPTICAGLIGLLLASLLAAVMSSSDAQMVVSSGLFTENIYKRFLFKNRSQKHYLWVGRISGLFIVALAIILQSTFQDVIHALGIIIKTPAAIGISLWVGILWRGWTPIAVWVSTIVAACTWGFTAYFPGVVADALPWTAEEWFLGSGDSLKIKDSIQMVLYLSMGFLSGYLVSLITPRASKEKLDHFFTLVHTPIRPGEEVHAPCTLPDDPLPVEEKMFPNSDIELPKPKFVDIAGFVAAWIGVGFLVWLTVFLAKNL